MITTLIFDLSEVLIAGLMGIEEDLSPRLGILQEEILPAFGGQLLHDLCCGWLSEDAYLAEILARQRWHITPHELKEAIRINFRKQVPGMTPVLLALSQKYQLVLLSDHALEWIRDIRRMHPFLVLFQHQIFSFQLQQTKQEASTFTKLLAIIQKPPEACLFIDDSTQNVSAAENSGIRGICFTNAGQLRQELKMTGIDLS